MKNLFAIGFDEMSFLLFRFYNRLLLVGQSETASKSDSENTSYVSALNQILRSERKLSRFRKTYKYKAILEHLSYKQGQAYFEILASRAAEISKISQIALKNDSFGKPRIFNYSNRLKSSPTTLRYLKVSSDLDLLFGNNLGVIAEIGAGYGGQASIIFQTHRIENYFIFDLPPAQALINQYLSRIDVDAQTTMVDIKQNLHNFDLVISNYAFSELPRDLQLSYCEKVIRKSKQGYLTMNSGLTNHSGRSNGKMSLVEIGEYLPNYEIFKEEPLTGPDNYILVWGHRETELPKIFL